MTKSKLFSFKDVAKKIGEEYEVVLNSATLPDGTAKPGYGIKEEKGELKISQADAKRAVADARAEFEKCTNSITDTIDSWKTNKKDKKPKKESNPILKELKDICAGKKDNKVKEKAKKKTKNTLKELLKDVVPLKNNNKSKKEIEADDEQEKKMLQEELDMEKGMVRIEVLIADCEKYKVQYFENGRIKAYKKHKDEWLLGSYGDTFAFDKKVLYTLFPTEKAKEEKKDPLLREIIKKEIVNVFGTPYTLCHFEDGTVEAYKKNKDGVWVIDEDIHIIKEDRTEDWEKFKKKLADGDEISYEEADKFVDHDKAINSVIEEIAKIRKRLEEGEDFDDMECGIYLDSTSKNSLIRSKIDESIKRIEKEGNDSVNHPSHYQDDKVGECIDVIEKLLTPEEFKGYCLGCALKYRYRKYDKSTADENLSKADWYTKRYNKAKGE